MSHPEATFGWAEAHLAQTTDGTYVWLADGGVPERCALGLVERPGVVAVTLAPARADVRWVGLALQVAHWLTRSTGPLTDGLPAAHVTSRHPPVAPRGAVRIPHLVTVRRGLVHTDEVVWEIAPAAAVIRRWGELPDLAALERHLPTLLRLRRAARTGRLPLTTAAERLRHLLDGDELAIELVVQRFDLFRVLGAHDQPL